jgi:hypothetical protein
MILGYDKGIENGVIYGYILIYVAKWRIWKLRHNIKYQNILCQTDRLLEYLKLN